MELFRQLDFRQTNRQTDRWTDRAIPYVAIATENNVTYVKSASKK